MSRLRALGSVCLLLAGCPFTPEDLELTAGSPSLGAGSPGGPQGGPMSEPDLNALVPEQTQEDVRAASHRMLQGTVTGDCSVSVRIDVLQGPPAPGDLGTGPKKGDPDAPSTGKAEDQPASDKAALPEAAPAGGTDPLGGAGLDGAPKPGPGGPPEGNAMGPITTLRLESPGPFAIAAPTDRSLRLVALCDGNEDGYLTHSSDRISAPTDLGVPQSNAEGIVLVLAEPQIPGGPPGGGPSGPPGGGPGGPPGGGPGGPPGGGPGGPPPAP